MSSGAPLIFAKQGGGLFAACEESEAWMAKRKYGALVNMEPLGVRNVDRLNLYWVFMGLVAENHSELTSKEAVDEAVKQLAGHIEIYSCTLPGGRRQYFRRTKSIAIASMKEHEFEAYLDRVVQIIGTQLLPGADVDEMRKEAYVRASVTGSQRVRA